MCVRVSVCIGVEITNITCYKLYIHNYSSELHQLFFVRVHVCVCACVCVQTYSQL